MSQPVRENYAHIEQSAAAGFFKEIEKRNIEKKNFKPANGKCHFDRYTYKHNGESVSIVYDTKAKLLTITAPAASMPEFDAIAKEAFGSGGTGGEADRLRESEKTPLAKIVAPAEPKKTAAPKNKSTAAEPKSKTNDKKSTKSRKLSDIDQKKSDLINNLYADSSRISDLKQNYDAPDKRYVAYDYQMLLKSRDEEKDKPKQLASASREIAALPAASGTKHIREQPGKQDKAAKNTDLKKEKNNSASGKSDKNSLAASKPDQGNVPAEDQKQELPEYKNGYSVKKITKEKLDRILQHLKEIPDIKIQIVGTISPGTPNEITTFVIEDKVKQKVLIRYMVRKNVLQLQGKRSNLFGEVQVRISRDVDYADAVESHIELTGDQNQPKQIQKQLKKLLPDAFEYLSEQSKIDLAIGLIDINNDDVRLSDYSVLLVPPYRGLERLIYDLQKAQDIDVKMIGQAFEKDESNNYMLKAGYQKKINSVVYNEVMSALYTEYFAKRNFYAHSDNSLISENRIISDKAQAKIIFDNMLELINYNGKKLKEIRFSIR